MPPLLIVVAVAVGVGFLGGLLGKGGSAIATPILFALGVPAAIAVAAPLPATIPSTLVAANEYRRHRLIDPDVLRWSILAGVPATIVGALATRWIQAGDLVLVTDLLLVGLGLRLLLGGHAAPGEAALDDAAETRRVVGVAVATGLAAGLLANSGGFLLAPLFVTVLRLPVKPALGTSLAAAAALAVPGSLVHLALGHLDLRIVLAFAIGAIPAAAAGARVALRVDPQRLERFYGAALVVLGAGFVLKEALLP